VGPSVDIAGLARAFGVESARAETPAAFEDALSTALRSPRPFVIEAVVDQPVAGARD
jgi:thiamine pyrophosphate-dependent acetolactate synthase large subunit-like protein